MIIYFQSIFLNVLGILPSIFSNHISEIHAFQSNKSIKKQEFPIVADRYVVWLSHIRTLL